MTVLSQYLATSTFTYTSGYTDAGTTDDEGNPNVTQATDTFTAVLVPDSVNNLPFQPGEQGLVYLRGACAEPTTLPSVVKEGDELAVSYRGVTGRFVMTAILPPSPFLDNALNDMIGQQFIGHFARTAATT